MDTFISKGKTFGVNDIVLEEIQILLDYQFELKNNELYLYVVNFKEVIDIFTKVLTIKLDDNWKTIENNENHFIESREHLYEIYFPIYLNKVNNNQHLTEMEKIYYNFSLMEREYYANIISLLQFHQEIRSGIKID
jgi:hypothetical protein